MDNKAFQKMSYGLYLISSKEGEKAGGCVVNTLMQATSSPLQVSVTINKENYTTELIQKSGRFAGAALTQEASMELIGAFGFQSSKEKNKFEGFQTQTDEAGIPYVSEQVAACFSCKVKQTMDAGTHIIFLAEVENAVLIDDKTEPMTYSYYHKVKNGVTPPKASSFIPEEKKGFRCKVCGYVLQAESVPDDFVCPICKQGKDKLEKL